jgi:hypothetical protein
VPPRPEYFEFLLWVSNFTIFSSSKAGKNFGFDLMLAPWENDEEAGPTSSQNLSTVVILSFNVGNIKETNGDRPDPAAMGVKLTYMGLISPLGLYCYLDLKGALKKNN